MSRCGVLLLALGLTGIAGCSALVTFDEPVLSVDEVRAGDGFTCVTLEEGGELWCWGANNYGQGGIGKIGDGFWTTTPQPVHNLEHVRSFDAGFTHVCAVDEVGKLWCWGNNDRHQLGSDPINLQSEPALVAGVTDAVTVSVGHDVTCAVTAGQQLFCFGDNSYRQLTSGVPEEYSGTPHEIELPDAPTAVAVGRRHVCALSEAHEVYCWGMAYHGQIGVPGITDGVSCGEGGEFCVDSPRQVSAITDVEILASGGDHTCAKLYGGRLYCWGANTAGQVGNGSTDNAFEPVEILPVDASGWENVAVGGDHTCAIDSNGQLWCWGLNERDQIGTGESNVAYYTQPRSVELPENPVGLGLGENHSCAVLENGRLYCWGSDDSGQIVNDGQDALRPTPVHF